MRFVTLDEAQPILRRFKRRDKTRKGVALYGDRTVPYQSIATPLVAELGEIQLALLYADEIVFGDSWDNGAVSDPRWSSYYKWRRARGDDRRLYDARGHLFDPGESELLAEAVNHAIVLGWDARLLA